MSLKPIDKRNPMQTRAALWAAIRELQEFTPRQLRGETRCTQGQTEEYLKGLAAAGIVERRETGLYALINDCGNEAPRVRRDGTLVTMGMGREQMWRTMRLLGDFTALDLAISSSTEDTPVKENTAKEYCRFLTLAGYLVEIRRGRGGIPSIFRFLPSQYTGPKPPMIQTCRQVWDANTERVVWMEVRHDQN